ncbi:MULTISPECIES: MFS transporter [unclassified Endozoicomonas]|uniref:MFS transporter n=2 Tax=Endozoicomonas TaxID=305899 RepID=UPI0021493166|nr:MULTISPECIES: MFS transporter [unclassified Endozoicomonas]
MQQNELGPFMAKPVYQSGDSIKEFSRFGPVFMLGAGQTTLLICLPAIVEETGLGYGLLTAMVALGTCLFIFTSPVWGRISDRFGRRKVVQAGLFGFATSFLLLAFALHGLSSGLLGKELAIGLMFLARILYGLLVSGLYPAVQAWVIDDSEDSNRMRSLSRITASINAGRFIGPVIPAVLIDQGSLFPVLALVILAIPLLIQVSILTTDKPLEVKQEKNSEEKKQFRQMLKSLWPVLLVACSVTTLFGLLQYLIGPILQERFSFDGVSASRVLSMLMMVAAFSTVVTHLLVSRFAQGRLILSLKVGSILLLVGSFLMITATLLICLIFGLVICAASIALLTPAYTTLASEQVDQQGVLTGTLSMIHTLGYTLGAILAGLGGSLGIQLAEVFCIFLAVLLLMISFLLVESPKRRNC